MRNIISGLVALSIFWSNIALGAGVSSETSDRVRLLVEKADKMATGKAAEYAKESLEAAQATISSAQAAILAGKEKEALQNAELADLQLKTVDAKAEEKDILEQVALRRSELKKLEAKLERYRQGEEQ